MQQWLAVFIGAVIQMALGMFWYSPVGFGKPWMREMNIKMDNKSKKGMGKYYLAAFVGSILTAFVLSRVIVLTGARSAGAGAATGILLWLGFVVPIMLGSVLWERKSVKLYIINVGYYLVSMTIIGAVIGGLV